ncbi:uncharacterized protein BDZ83DRAFT_637748 [Colletotrichum acutatum]|uniref:Uncharacterized protein n=1 Tax=Glomerella acutata TaxID=27357 RepID=A0AAD8UDC3_GLOAC|nr:uncharacterized protein BDZ83DRAFT_637748 [Colletotrichum acutatum]KAK1713373.1 hypothetical protein BDZ83DRAFT_637748 [Colletotrichum acutatum]
MPRRRTIQRDYKFDESLWLFPSIEEFTARARASWSSPKPYTMFDGGRPWIRGSSALNP